LAEFLEDVIFNDVKGVLKLSDVRTVTVQLTSQVARHPLQYQQATLTLINI